MSTKATIEPVTIISKWDIISKLNNSPTNIATKLNKSLPAITQQLKLLEAYGIITKDKQILTGNVGKPQTIYQLSNDLLVIGTTNPSTLKVQKSNDFNHLLVNLIALDNPELAHAIMKAILTYEGFYNKLDGLSIIKASKEQIELFILTEATDEYRKKHSNFDVKIEGKKIKIICWTHNNYEVEDGLRRNEQHFKNLLNNSQIIYDPERKIQGFKK